MKIILNLKVYTKNQKYLSHKIIELAINAISVNDESKQQKEQSKVSYETKLQSKVQCNSEDYKRAPTSFNDLKDNYIINEFVASSKKQEKQGNKKHQENSKCSVHEDVTKKEKKVEFNLI